MLLKAADLENIKAGRIDTAFRRWSRPTVKAGGTLMTAIGVLAIEAVDIVDGEVAPEDARRAGFDSVAALRRWLEGGRPGQLYRIRMRYAGADPRIALRASAGDAEEIDKALARLDARGAWTGEVLALIEAHPGRVAQALADEMGLDKLKFKARVRQLKALGLTESLEIGYRLSPRGAAVLARRRGPIASA
ncbi:hypothetical protein GCM10007913_10340 [Devosia yakushimensis]|uniref:ASCH domain-containing protein n=1 Tax=Devosia yakushimensis TaxID=470028 RepID=A0ABQ5UCN3_9HYPH|nr:hypothetical protein [Devosia yakushimensis]GLQ09102.1 hypothetical protein GCM10007913_10340 [Devosia yakushimensis]